MVIHFQQPQWIMEQDSDKVITIMRIAFMILYQVEK